MHLGLLHDGRHRSLAAVLGTALALVLGCGEPLPKITVLTPAHGTFTTASSILVTGTATGVPVANMEVTVNGTVAPLQPDGSFSLSVPISQSQILNPLKVQVEKLSSGYVTFERVMVIGGPAIADGFFSGNGLGMRINDSALDQLEPLINSLVGGDLDITDLVLGNNPIASTFQCIIPNPFGGCITGVTINVNATNATFSSFGVNLDAIANLTRTVLTINDVRVDYNTSGISCSGNVRANTTTITGDYDQLPGNPASTLDVNQSGNVAVSFSGFNNSFTGGICDFPIIGDIIQLIIGNVEPIVRDGLVTALADPDGAGAQDAPIAEALETSLAGLELAGPIGAALGVELDADFNDIAEDNLGLTYRLDSRIVNPAPLPTAPDQLASYHTTGAFPGFGPTTPVGNQPYGLALAISPSSFNQLLKAEIEDGLLQVDITEFDLGQGGPPLPLTAGLLALFLPEFGNLAPGYPLTVEIRPTLAPFLTGQNGPGGEAGDLRTPQVVGTIVGEDSFGAEIEFLRVAFDARIGLDFAVVNGELAPSISEIDPGDVDVAVLQAVNATTEAQLQAFLPELIALVLPDLGTSLGSFPLPEFLGLQLAAADDVRKVGEYLVLYVNLQ